MLRPPNEAVCVYLLNLGQFLANFVACNVSAHVGMVSRVRTLCYLLGTALHLPHSSIRCGSKLSSYVNLKNLFCVNVIFILKFKLTTVKTFKKEAASLHKVRGMGGKKKTSPEFRCQSNCSVKNT